MQTTSVTFRCPTDLLKQLDEDAEADHRARSSMLVKILAAYYSTTNSRLLTKAGK